MKGDTEGTHCKNIAWWIIRFNPWPLRKTSLVCIVGLLALPTTNQDCCYGYMEDYPGHALRMIQRLWISVTVMILTNCSSHLKINVIYFLVLYLKSETSLGRCIKSLLCVKPHALHVFWMYSPSLFLHTGSANDFLYTRQGRSPVIDGVDDTKELCTTRNAFTLLGNTHTLAYN